MSSDKTRFEPEHTNGKTDRRYRLREGTGLKVCSNSLSLTGRIVSCHDRLTGESSGSGITSQKRRTSSWTNRTLRSRCADAGKTCMADTVRNDRRRGCDVVSIPGLCRARCVFPDRRRIAVVRPRPDSVEYIIDRGDESADSDVGQHGLGGQLRTDHRCGLAADRRQSRRRRA